MKICKTGKSKLIIKAAEEVRIRWKLTWKVNLRSETVLRPLVLNSHVRSLCWDNQIIGFLSCCSLASSLCRHYENCLRWTPMNMSPYLSSRWTTKPLKQLAKNCVTNLQWYQMHAATPHRDREAEVWDGSMEYLSNVSLFPGTWPWVTEVIVTSWDKHRGCSSQAQHSTVWKHILRWCLMN